MTSHRFTEGDRVRVDIPGETDIDHDRFHGETGTVIAVAVDDAGNETGDERDSIRYRIELGEGEIMTFRWRDLRPL